MQKLLSYTGEVFISQYRVLVGRVRQLLVFEISLYTTNFLGQLFDGLLKMVFTNFTLSPEGLYSCTAMKMVVIT